MQFTTRITVEDFVEAYRLQCKSLHRTITSTLVYIFAAIFWIFFAGAWISERLRPDDLFLGQDPHVSQLTVLPAAIGLLAWILIFRVFVPYGARRQYKKLKSLHGEISNEVTPEGLMQRTSSGSYGFSSWKDFSYWRESRRAFIVVYPSKIFCMIPKTGLTEEQLGEIRSTLAAALPKK
jgi:YcxB-like protein